MATRYAGDYFGLSMGDMSDSDSSKLMSYFPALRSTYSKKKQEDGGPVLFGGVSGVKPFGGFKPNLGSFAPKETNEKMQTGVFGGSKPGEF